MLEDPQHSDVVFIVEGEHRLQAHKLLLSAASSFFQKVLGITGLRVSRQCIAASAVCDDNNDDHDHDHDRDEEERNKYPAADYNNDHH